MRALPALIAALCVAACQGPAAPDGGGDPIATGGGELRDALRFTEAGEQAPAHDIAPGQHRAGVDYKSELRITPDAIAIGRLVVGGDAKGGTPDAAESARIAALEAVPALVAQARDLAAEAARALAAADAQRREGKVDASTIADTQLLLQREADLRLGLMQLLEDLERAKILAAEPGLTTEQVDERIGEALAAAVPDDAKLDFGVVEKRLHEELIAARASHEKRRVALDEAVAKGDAEYGFRLRAQLWSGEESAALHVDNYDNLAETFAVKPPRFSFGSPSERAQLEREMTAIGTLLEFGSAAGNGKLEVAERWQALRAALVADRDALLASFQLPEGGADFATLDAMLAAAIADPELAEPAKVRALRDVLERVARVVETVERLAGSGIDRTLGEWLAVSGDLGGLLDDVRKLVRPGTVAAIVEGVKELETWAAAKVKDTVANAPTLLAKSRAAFETQLARLTADLEPLTDLLLLIHGRLAPEAIRRAASDVAPLAAPRPLDDLVPGTVKLHRSIADRGDEVDVIAELVRRKANGDGYEVVQQATRTFVVDRFGLVNDLSADVAFIRQRGEDHFRTAPSAAWTLHWRTRDTPEDSGWRDTWQGLDPGVGLSVVGISTDDESFQPGVGAHLSLFHDVVKVGVGYNLGADSHRDYWFVGIGLFEALDGIGNLFGGGRSRDAKR